MQNCKSQQRKVSSGFKTHFRVEWQDGLGAGQVKSVMRVATVTQFSLSVTSSFAEILPLSEAGLDQIAKNALKRFGGYGLRPLEILHREGDKMFDYEMNFSLFNRNGKFRINAEDINVTFLTARNEQDVGIISDCLAGIFESLAGRPVTDYRLESYVHLALDSAEERNAFLASLGNQDRALPIKGAILYFSAVAAPDSRLLVDRSLYSEDAVFFNWSVQYPSIEDLLTKSLPGFEEVCEKMGLTLPKIDRA